MKSVTLPKNEAATKTQAGENCGELSMPSRTITTKGGF